MTIQPNVHSNPTGQADTQIGLPMLLVVSMLGTLNGHKASYIGTSQRWLPAPWYLAAPGLEADYKSTTWTAPPPRSNHDELGRCHESMPAPKSGLSNSKASALRFVPGQWLICVNILGTGYLFLQLMEIPGHVQHHHPAEGHSLRFRPRLTPKANCKAMLSQARCKRWMCCNLRPFRISPG